MKKVGIFVGSYYNNWDEISVQEGMGGSETWAIEIAKQFSKYYEVIVYAYPSIDHNINDNLRLVDYHNYYSDIKNKVEFDYFIFSRFTDVINPYLRCDNVYVMVHDVCCNCYYSIGLGRVKKYGYLSEWHKNNLLTTHKGLTEDYLLKTTNGFSKELYDKYKNLERTNSMVWSSHPSRGFFTIYNSIITELIKEFPDFKVHICGGTMDQEGSMMLSKASKLPNVIVHGSLSKDDLAKLQCKSKIWIYPGIFPETFCITAVENAYAGNCIIAPGSYGLATTLYPYKGFEILGNKPFSIENRDTWIQLAKSALLGENSELIQESSLIAAQYSWERAAQEWINEFNRSDE